MPSSVPMTGVGAFLCPDLLSACLTMSRPPLVGRVLVGLGMGFMVFHLFGICKTIPRASIFQRSRDVGLLAEYNSP